MRKLRVVVFLVVAVGVVVFGVLMCETTVLPEWIPSDLENENPVSWSCDISAGELICVIAQSDREKWTWDNTANSIKRVAIPYKSTYTKLTFSHLQELIKPTVKWMKQEKQSVAQLDYISPKYFWAEHTNGSLSSNGIVMYSISKKTISRLKDGIYTGSREYGVITISTQQGVWIMFINE